MTLTIELMPEVMDRLSRKAAEQRRPVEAVVADIISDAAIVQPSVDDAPAQAVREVMNFGRRHGISGEGFDVIAAKREGRRF